MEKTKMRVQAACLLVVFLLMATVVQAANDEQKLIGLWESYAMRATEDGSLRVRTFGVEFKADKTFLITINLDRREEMEGDDYTNTYHLEFKVQVRGTWSSKEGQIYAKPVPSSLQGGLTKFIPAHDNQPRDAYMNKEFKQRLENLDVASEFADFANSQINWSYKLVGDRFLVTDVETESPSVFVRVK